MNNAMTHGGIDSDWDMFLRGRSDARDPFGGTSNGPQELEPDLSDDSPEKGRVRHFNAPVVGLPYPNADGTSRREAVAGLRRWERVRLRHRPDNPVDVNAVAVLRDSDERQLGYLPATLAAEVVESARQGTRYLAVVSEVSAPGPDDLIAVAPVGATLLLLVLESGATAAMARRHLLDLMNGPRE
jgi:hypothetical protein